MVNTKLLSSASVMSLTPSATTGASLTGAIDKNTWRTVVNSLSDAEISSATVPLKLAGGSPLMVRVARS